MRTNKRRNLTSSQWAYIAVKSEEIVQVLKKEAKERMIEGGKNKGCQQVGNPRVDKQLADTFNTNKTYISAAQRLKEEKPETSPGFIAAYSLRITR